MDTKEFIQGIITNELTGCFADCSQDNIDKLVDILNRHHEHQAKDNKVLGDVVCSFIQKTAKDNSLPVDELYIQYDINDKELHLYQDDYGNGIEYVKTLK